MPEAATELVLFIILGIIAWVLARRFPIEDYGQQRVEPFDCWFLIIAMVMAAAIDAVLGSLCASLASHLYRWAAPLRQHVAGLSITTQVVLYLTASDFFGYWIHRLLHSRVLWRFHAFHHSARALNWLSGMRGSPLHVAFILAPGALMASMLLLTDSRFVFFILFVIEIFSQHLTHSNLRLPFSRQIEWLLVTPRMHFVHHHRDSIYGNSNYGFYFSIWDHIFGTYIDPAKVTKKAALGLSENYTKKSLFLGFHLTRVSPNDAGERK